MLHTLSLTIVVLTYIALLVNGKVVDLGYAKLQSDVSLVEGVISFLGIRYAEAPIGNLRWRAPRPPPASSEIQNATAYGIQCIQGSIRGNAGTALTSPYRDASGGVGQFLGSQETDDGMLISDEDCLFLNVHVPVKESPKLLPVIVYIHGGGYDAGNTSVYPVENWVNTSDFSLVVVNIQYRLGVFGFLSSAQIKNDGDLNVGLLDQNYALQWVQKHISAFGGDPSQVTIWGQSAGAGSMLQHIVAHAGNTQPPLFRAVMMNSPFLPFQYHYNDPIPEKVYSRVVEAVNCTKSDVTLSCLRSVNASSLFAADFIVGSENFLGVYTFVPVVDETFIVERPTETLSRGQVNGEILIASTNQNEGGLFVPPDVLIANNFTLKEYVTELLPRFNSEQIHDAVQMYSGLDSVADEAAEVIGDVIFKCPGYFALSAFESRRKPTWKALFSIPPALHADDLSYEFPGFIIPPTYKNPDFQNAFMQSWLSGAAFLNPNIRFEGISTITPSWSKWSTCDNAIVINGTESDTGFMQSWLSSIALGIGSSMWSSCVNEMVFNKTASDTPFIHPVSTSVTQLDRCRFWANASKTNSQ